MAAVIDGRPIRSIEESACCDRSSETRRSLRLRSSDCLRGCGESRLDSSAKARETVPRNLLLLLNSRTKAIKAIPTLLRINGANSTNKPSGSGSSGSSTKSTGFGKLFGSMSGSDGRSERSGSDGSDRPVGSGGGGTSAGALAPSLANSANVGDNLDIVMRPLRLLRSGWKGWRPMDGGLIVFNQAA